MRDLILYATLLSILVRSVYYERARSHLITTKRATSQDALAIEWELVRLRDARKTCERRLRARLSAFD